MPGRFSFRFSRKPSCVTVDYTVQDSAVEGRPQVSKQKRQHADADCCCWGEGERRLVFWCCLFACGGWVRPPFVFQASVSAREGVAMIFTWLTCDGGSGGPRITRK